MKEFSVLDGRPHVLRGSAVWHLDDGPFEYVRLNLCDDVEYNVWPRRSLSDMAGSDLGGVRQDPQGAQGRGWPLEASSRR